MNVHHDILYWMFIMTNFTDCSSWHFILNCHDKHLYWIYFLHDNIFTECSAGHFVLNVHDDTNKFLLNDMTILLNVHHGNLYQSEMFIMALGVFHWMFIMHIILNVHDDNFYWVFRWQFYWIFIMSLYAEFSWWRFLLNVRNAILYLIICNVT